MEGKTENVLKQEWLKKTVNYKHFLSITFSSAIVPLFVNVVFPKFFTPGTLLLSFFIILIFNLGFYGDVWTYFAKFSFNKEGLSMKIAGFGISSKNICYEKIIYASEQKPGIKYKLALEVWFGREPIVFSENLASIDGRTEEVYHGKGMEAHYWTRNPGKIDELARFIDQYKTQAKDV